MTLTNWKRDNPRGMSFLSGLVPLDDAVHPFSCIEMPNRKTIKRYLFPDKSCDWVLFLGIATEMGKQRCFYFDLP